MFPGFITAYRDKNNYVHLYFFPGIDNHGNNIYRDIDINCININYTKNKNIDNSIEYKFLNKKIIQLNCKLLSNFSEEEFNYVIQI